jgi:hypothetical protein
MRHQRATAHFLQSADRLFLRKLHDGGPLGVVGLGLGRPERETVVRYRLDGFVLPIEVFLQIEGL